MAKRETAVGQEPKVLDETNTAEPKRVVSPRHRQTVGEIDYNAYCDARNWKAVDGSQIPSFKEQDKDIAAAWELAGNAVRVAVEADDFYTTEERSVFKTMVREKMAAGLTQDQAESVAREEIESQKRAKAERERKSAPVQETAKA